MSRRGIRVGTHGADAAGVFLSGKVPALSGEALDKMLAEHSLKAVIEREHGEIEELLFEGDEDMDADDLKKMEKLAKEMEAIRAEAKKKAAAKAAALVGGPGGAVKIAGYLEEAVTETGHHYDGTVLMIRVRIPSSLAGEAKNFDALGHFSRRAVDLTFTPRDEPTAAETVLKVPEAPASVPTADRPVTAAPDGW